MRSITAILCVATPLLFSLAAPSQAALIDLTYAISASDFLNSNSQPPPAPTSSSVAGTVTFTIDDSFLSGEQDDIVPLALSGIDITRNDGTVTDYNTGNALVDFSISAGKGLIVLGGAASSNDFMIGLSDDFRIVFEVDLTTYEVLTVLEKFVFVTTSDPFYSAQATDVSLLSVSPSVVPLPAAGYLMLSACAALGALQRARGRRRPA
ncbi:hypothetical protein E4634_10495 [Mangrovimicrobium sediminis]|uniref:VPLPA-CTERM sorting domain-containing protein n=1 Tax=Mangrovimicrobium sediminis TaxID=2562682 RepID=A0A4Z0M1Z1_9GAMM|nr:VPLPA-CTERM sorting domain-containing protein [Haliea sp. SAOS-164]TGD73454.1 hypothetical protein E4634_10495 [Haliea sp. SAOS-164]